MTRTAEQEFHDGLNDLIRLAERCGLDRERDVLRCLTLGRTYRFGDQGPVAEMAACCAEVIDGEGRSNLRPDPAFPPAGWSGRKPKIDRGMEDDY